MTYFEFLHIVWPIKKHKHPEWRFRNPINLEGNRGAFVYMENDGSVVLSVDIGNANEVEITRKKINEKVAVKEVFENYRGQY